MTKQEMKELLMEGWKAVFPESDANEESDFFTDGGDSITAVQLTSWLLQKGVKLDMMKVFSEPVLGNLAETLEETQPMKVPEKMMTKEALKEMGINPALVSKFAQNGAAPADGTPAPQAPVANGPSQNPQMCTPAQNRQAGGPSQNPQMCTPAQNRQANGPSQNPQMCTPAQNRRAGGPSQNPQMCTPAANGRPMAPMNGFGAMGGMPYMPGAYSMPMMPYMMPMVVMVPVMPYMMPMMPNMPAFPMQGNPFGGQGAGGFGGINPQLMQQFAQYQARPVNEPIQNPTIMKIEKPHVGVPTETPEVALDEVLKSIFPAYDRNTGLLEQGFTSLNMMQIVTRLGEHGYSIHMQDIVANPSFDGILPNMKAGEQEDA